VARNRKRAKERRARRPQPAAARQGAASARPDRSEDAADPLRHAAPDVELADAQMAVGRPELADAEPEVAEAEPVLNDAAAPESLDEEEFEELETEVDELAEVEAAGDDAGAGAGGPPPQQRPRGGDADGGGELAPVGAAAPEHHVRHGNRLINFLRGSWNELQRVQWPDRRQVIQATSVVIGFVIVAGVFLGVADLVSTKIMNFILK
jgi:preprotein translocase subunit SecE